MDRNRHLIEMGERIRNERNRQKMNQIEFYRKLFPDQNLEEENIKKKMNSIENGKKKRIEIDFILQICDTFNVSLDYLFGYEKEYPNYQNKAACEYTGLSPEAIEQLHFWSQYKNQSQPVPSPNITDQEYRDLCIKTTRIQEAKWILDIASKLFEKKNEADERSGIADLSILYDLYMMTLKPPVVVHGISEDNSNNIHSSKDEEITSLTIKANSITYSDEMREIHHIDIADINQQVWKNRLMQDVETFINDLSQKRDS